MSGFSYTASRTVADFMRDNSFMRVLCGPLGGGKTAGCCVEIGRRCMEMPPMPDGIRRSRWVIVRNTRAQLRDTILKSFLQWWPPSTFGRWKESEMVYHMAFNDVEAEILFRALDSPEDVQRVLSLELTGAHLEEARELPLDVVLAIQGRLGRYPARRDVAEYWFGMICSTNPPEIDSTWYRIMEGVPIEDNNEDSVLVCSTYRQPSGLATSAENVEFLAPDYYSRLAEGKTQAWIDTYIHGKYSPSQLGKPVYHTSFNHERHVSQTPLRIDPQLPVVIGFDCGLTPAAGFFQMGLDGRVRLLREAYAFDMGMKRFAQNHLRPIVRNYFPTNPLIFIGDPSGGNRAQSDEATAFQMIKLMFEDDAPTVKAAPTNDLAPRIQALEQLLCQYPDGEPLFLIDPGCKRTIDALRSKYRYPKLKMSGEFSASPEKNDWSHLTEALQYGALFLLGGRYTPGDYMRTPNTDPFNFMQKPAYRPAQREGY